jgi:hypothetical protein
MRKGDGLDISMISFEYSNGFCNRSKRQFYRFDIVRFRNSNYFTKVAWFFGTFMDSNDRKQTGSKIFILKIEKSNNHCQKKLL